MSEKGVVLVITLWIILILMVSGMNLSYSTRTGMLSLRNVRESIESGYALNNAMVDVMEYLSTDDDPLIDYIDNNGRLHIDKREPFPETKRYSGYDVVIGISDECSRLDINTISDQNLWRLFHFINVSPDRISGMIDSLRDWIDPDNLRRLSGAEDEYYSQLLPPYSPRNAPLQLPEELYFIRNFDEKILNGSEDSKPLFPYITTFCQGRLNLNSVSKDVMEILGIDTLTIENVLSGRDTMKGYRAVPQNLRNLFNATSTDTFRVELRTSRKRVVTVIKRIPGKNGYDLRTLYWKEYEGTES